MSATELGIDLSMATLLHQVVKGFLATYGRLNRIKLSRDRQIALGRRRPFMSDRSRAEASLLFGRTTCDIPERGLLLR